MRKNKIVTLTVVLIMLFCISGCSKQNGGPDCRSIMNACSSITKNETFDTCVCYGEDLYEESFDGLYGVQYDMIDDGAILYTATGGVADEISIFHIKKGEDVSIAREKMQDRIEERITTFSGYKPEEVYKLENAIIMVQGKYVALIVADDSESFENEIRRVISEGGK